jgi:RNA polymerase sigma factor for flagellar operon FliA
MDVAAASTTQEAALWQRLRNGGDAQARDDLLALHMPYAKVVAAAYFSRRFHNQVEFGEYFQFASLGLLEAMERYDPGRGVQFRTFAARRMHGAILNGLERLTEKQQQIAARQRMRAERMQDVKSLARESGGGSAPMQADQLLRFVSDVGIGLALCWMLEGTGMVEIEEASTTAPVYQGLALKQARDRLLHALDALPPQERTVIRNHYLQEIPFDEIAAMLNLTKGRISQIHKQALLRLRALVRDHADWDATL